MRIYKLPSEQLSGFLVSISTSSMLQLRRFSASIDIASGIAESSMTENYRVIAEITLKFGIGG
jgi:hypothetical protein